MSSDTPGNVHPLKPPHTPQEDTPPNMIYSTKDLTQLYLAMCGVIKDQEERIKALESKIAGQTQ